VRLMMRLPRREYTPRNDGREQCIHEIATPWVQDSQWQQVQN